MGKPDGEAKRVAVPSRESTRECHTVHTFYRADERTKTGAMSERERERRGDCEKAISRERKRERERTGKKERKQDRLRARERETANYRTS